MNGQQIGPFTVEKELGSGAMGTVYLARYQDDKRVALKFMSPSLGANDKAMARFEREAEILKQLRHPNIVRLIGHGKYRNAPFYAMEFIEGESLDRILARRGKLPWQEVVQLGKQLCAALQHAHEKGIVHRDLKPSNLMILKDGTLKLTDFGIAKDLDLTQLTSGNCTVGTASYMSPEQCKGDRNISHRSDLYSLGIVFYELLTGEKPFQADNAMEMLLQHVKGKFDRPSRLEMDIPVWLDTLVCHLLEKKPDKRPFDASVVASALDQVVEKVTVQRSAGVDAVTSRTMEKLPTGKTKAEDKEAARTLMTGLGKGKRKKKKHLFQRAWFQALGIIVALAGVITLIALAVMPPSEETLYTKAAAAWNSNDATLRDNALNMPSGAINKYLRYYGSKAEEYPRSQEVLGWADAIKAEQQERGLYNRARIGLEPSDDLEQQARAALNQEETGEINQAMTTWQELLQNKDKGSQLDRVYALIAQKHLRELAEVNTLLMQLSRKVDLLRAGQAAPGESDSETTALEALRYARFGDAALAYNRWQSLKIKHEQDEENRRWLLLAAWQTDELKAKRPPATEEKDVRVKLVQDRLAQVEKLVMARRPGDALLLAREILTLYIDNPDVKDQVAQARDLAARLAPAP